MQTHTSLVELGSCGIIANWVEMYVPLVIVRWLGEGVRVHDLDEDGGIRESDVSFAGEVLFHYDHSLQSWSCKIRGSFHNEVSLGVKYWFEVATNPSPVLLPDLVVMKKNGATLDTVWSKQG